VLKGRDENEVVVTAIIMRFCWET